MNLELLDPFRRQIPDRVDATLNLPSTLHLGEKKKGKTEKEENEDWKAANYLAFNRRGTYIAVGYGSGAIGVYDVMSRTLSGLYLGNSIGQENKDSRESNGHGITTLSWSKRSRTILAGTAGKSEVRIVDTTHPAGPEECCAGISAQSGKDITETERSVPQSLESNINRHPNQSSFVGSKNTIEHHKNSRELKVKMLDSGKDDTSVKVLSGNKDSSQSHVPVNKSSHKRYPSLHFNLPSPLGTFLNLHPKHTSAGLAAVSDGSIVIFSIPSEAWGDSGIIGEESKVKVATAFESSTHWITCASFDTHGSKLYAGTNDGWLLGFEVASLFDHILNDSPVVSQLQPSFEIQISGGATIWDIVVSRHDQNIIINSSDAVIRLYKTKDCWTTPEEVEKPNMTFQDVVSKTKFVSCDISGDAEYVVGGVNRNDKQYELYIWSTSTGALMDKLTGAMVEIFKVSWHPTRSFIAVAASDGLVDIWGPRINWTAFAPDFQALPKNVEYVECEDEFDIHDSKDEKSINQDEEDVENEDVDVLTIEPVPVFASDSEDEGEVFFFDPKVPKLLGGEKA